MSLPKGTHVDILSLGCGNVCSIPSTLWLQDPLRVEHHSLSYRHYISCSQRLPVELDCTEARFRIRRACRVLFWKRGGGMDGLLTSLPSICPLVFSRSLPLFTSSSIVRYYYCAKEMSSLSSRSSLLVALRCSYLFYWSKITQLLTRSWSLFSPSSK